MAGRRGVAAPRRKSDDHLAESFPLSVVIPAYNSASYLRETLTALARNDLTAVEVIVVDDGSSDGTPDLVRNFNCQAPLTLLEQARGGPSAARNRGAREARHPYVLFLDSDVLLPERGLRLFRDSLDLYRHRPDIGGVLGCYSEEIRHRDFWSNYRNLTTIYLYEATETLSPYLHTPLCLLRKELLEEEGGFQESLREGEDFRLGLALGSRGYRFVIDRRIRGEHLKRYSAFQILREDWRRTQSLSSVELTREEKRFSWRAHRPSRLLSLLLAGPVLVLALLGVVSSWFFWAAGLLGLLFVLANGSLFRFLRKKRGTGFAARSLLFFYLQMLVAEAALAARIAFRR